MGKIWANVRALQLDVKGSIDYPNSGPRDPWGAGTIKGNEDENDAALRRAAHRELDRILDKMIPKMPRLPRWVAWSELGNTSTSAKHNVAHLVAERHGVRKVVTACGLSRYPTRPGQAAHFLVEPFNDGIKCAACAKIAATLRH